MVPTYAYQDPFPYQNGRMQYFPCFQPTSEGVSSPMMVDPSKVPVFCGTGPCGANYSHPAGWHLCCNHMPFHGNSYSPSYPHIFPPQPLPWWGSFPAYPQPIPIHHAPAPPVYVQENPRYEYAKDVRRADQHCCGCPKHVFNPKSEKNVVLEEELPSLDKEKPSPEGETPTQSSLVPPDMRNYQYPIIWIPSEYMNKQQKKPIEFKIVDPTSGFQELKPKVESCQQEANPRNVIPANTDNADHVAPVGDNKIVGTHQPKDKAGQFPCPIILMPHTKQVAAENDQKNASPNNSASNLSSDGNLREPHMLGNLSTKHAVQDIPMPEHEFFAANLPRGKIGEVTPDMSEKGGYNKVKGSSKTQKEKPKLPPVCLRVDPLPSRKDANGNSRSLSPPGTRENNTSSGVTDKKERKELAEVANEKTMNQEKKGVKVIEVMDGSADKKKGATVSKQQAEDPVILDGINGEGQMERQVAGEGIKENETVNVTQDEISGEGEREKRDQTVGRTLSDSEAATLIQAAYRGFELRKWETVKKLKQMARILEEMGKIKQRIKELESSHSSSLDKEKDTKQRMIICESIMSLLLTLDTIQGLHPNLRDIRKSLARELVALQEKLDHIVSKKLDEFTTTSEEQGHDDCAVDTREDPEISRKEELQSAGTIPGHDDQGLLGPSERQLLVAEEFSSSPLDDIESNQSDEPVNELEKLSDGGRCENMEKDGHEMLSSGTVKSGPTEELFEQADSKDPLFPDVEYETSLLMKLPNDGSSADEDHQEILVFREKEDVTREHYESREPLKEAAGGCKTCNFAEMEQLQRQETGESEVPGGSLVDENEPIKEYGGGGEVIPIAVQEEEEVPSKEMWPRGQIIDKCAFSESVYGEESQPVAEDEMKVVTTSFELSEEEDLTQAEDMPKEQGEWISQEEEIKEQHEENDWQGPEEGAEVEKMIVSPFSSEVPEEEEKVVVPEDEAAIKPDGEAGSRAKLAEENERLREMMQKLMEAGKEQVQVISGLTERVKDLEKKLARSKKTGPGPRPRPSRCKAAAVRPSRPKPSASAN